MSYFKNTTLIHKQIVFFLLLLNGNMYIQTSERTNFRSHVQTWKSKIRKKIRRARHRFKTIITKNSTLQDDVNLKLNHMSLTYRSLFFIKNNTIFDLLAQGPENYREVKNNFKQNLNYTALTDSVKNVISIIKDKLPESYIKEKENPFRLIANQCFESEYICNKSHRCINYGTDSEEKNLAAFLGAMGRFFEALANRWEKSKNAQDMILLQ